MQPSAVILVSIAILISSSPVISAFWLTDSTLFRPPIFLPQSSERVERQLAQTSSTSASEQQNAQNNTAAANPAHTQSSVASSQSMTTSNEASNNKSDIQTIDQQQPATNGNQAPQCSCSFDWLESQTHSLLNRWTSSAQFAARLQSLVGSNKATSSERQQQQSQQRGSKGSGRGLNPTGRWPVARGKWSHTRRGEQSSGGGGGGTSSAPAAAGPAPQAAKMSQQQQRQSNSEQQPIKLVQDARGPKGERGPRGPSGLISVQNREELFDLPEDKEVESATSGQSKAKHSARLALVELEQLLVVETSSGWRPVQLLAPLRDFRKTIAKFSLSSPADRRKLIASGSSLPISAAADDEQRRQASAPLSGNSLVWPVGNVGAKRPAGARSNAQSNSILVDSMYSNGRSADDEGDDGDDDDDDDEEEEDDDEESGANDDGAEEDNQRVATHSAPTRSPSGLDEEEEEEEEEEDNEDNGDNIRATNLTIEPKRRRAQITSRSAMGAAATNSVGADDNALPRSIAHDPKQQILTRGDQMKLRLIALNEPFAGNVHGLRGANFECKRNAARAQVRGAFRALLATNYQNLNEIVRPVPKYPIINLRGETLASSWTDLFKAPARVSNPLSRIQSFDGRHVATDSNWPNKLVWLGTGNKLGARDSSQVQNCDSWHSDSLAKFGYAVPLHSPRHYGSSNSGGNHTTSGHHRDRQQRSSGSAGNGTTQAAVFDNIQKYPCRMPLIVLCVETVAQAVE